MEIALIISAVGILIFLAHFFSELFSHTRVPDVLLLILIGLVIGPGLGLVHEADFGAVGAVLTTITLVVLLFEEGIRLSLPALAKAARGTTALSLVNFLVSMLAVGTVVMFLTDLGPALSYMLGAIVGSTSPAVVVPLVRQLPMKNESRNILSLESAVSDVFSIVVALGLFEFYKLGELRFGLMLGHMISSFALAMVLGFFSGLVWSVLLNKMRTLKNAMFTTPAFIFVVFGVAEVLGYSGYIAALTFGVTLGNIRSLNLSLVLRYVPHEPISLNQSEKIFVSEVAFLLKTFFFVYVGLSVHLSDLWSFSVGFALTAMLFLLRVPIVRLSISKSIPASDAAIMAVMTPKGLAAVVLAGIPLQQGVPGGDIIQHVAYAVVFFSIMLSALLVFLLERTPLAHLYGLVFAGFAENVAREGEGEEPAR